MPTLQIFIDNQVETKSTITTSTTSNLSPIISHSGDIGPVVPFFEPIYHTENTTNDEAQVILNKNNEINTVNIAINAPYPSSNFILNTRNAILNITTTTFKIFINLFCLLNKHIQFGD